MRRTSVVVRLGVLGLALLGPRPARAACCYFAAKDKDVLQVLLHPADLPALNERQG